MERAGLIAALERMGLARPGETVRLTPLTGGVSSDIHLVETQDRRFCIKRALARLKVAAVWEVSAARNAAEAAWLRTVGGWLSEAVPRILGEDADAGMFAMEYLPPGDNPVWKAELLQGRVDLSFAGSAGQALSTIHAKSAADPAIARAFANDETFEAIRIEPYLRATGRAHPDLGSRFEALAATTLAAKRALVHGDVSPKNILCGRNGPVFLDAECAWYGDPAFDIAFCLNHFLLKGARRGVQRDDYCDAFGAFRDAYFADVPWEDADVLEARAAALLPALFLARVDGKSPVEYLTRQEEKDAVRRFAIPLVAHPPMILSDIARRWRTHA